MAIELLNALTS